MMKTDVSEKLIDSSNAKYVDGSCTVTVDFYKSSSNDLKLSFGRANVKFYYNKYRYDIPNGFNNKYVFYPKSLRNEKHNEWNYNKSLPCIFKWKSIWN